MPLHTLLWLSLLINVITLVYSYFIIARIGKITKLTSLVYNELAITKMDLPSQPSGYKEDHTQMGLFEERTAKSSKAIESEPTLHISNVLADPLMERPAIDISDVISNKTTTRAEAHLVKILQAKYALQDEGGSGPRRN
jgi:hypothetical protein